ncbi:MAG: tRNA threonylcarbamoyladenosine dehydratase [Clostridiales bacterium]|jgi:tRNA A37 threonylcarbamoyladenosine dehydratase|nr:tRNA threonylcarbamoyladenosine dehydratase [Clostridiales bacterium]
MGQFSRTRMVLGDEALEKLSSFSVAIFGIGGVGSFAAEALARSAVGHLTLCDNDTVCESNLNRQLTALHSTLGKYKAEVMAQRILDINPNCKAEALLCFYASETAHTIDLSKFSYIVDAIDTVSSKILLAEKAKQANTPIISCMGTGNKLNPEMFEVADIYKTSYCPLAKVMRKELRARGITSLKVVYSREEPVSVSIENGGRHIPGSVSFVPPVAGMILAGEVIKDLIGK